MGGVRLTKLGLVHVEQLFASLGRDGVSARGRQMTGTMLHTALRDVVRLRLIPNNPAGEIAKPKPRREEMRVYDAAQARRLLDAAKADRLYALYVPALDAGMRQGELFALRWEDINLDTGDVMGRRSLEEIHGRRRPKETKTGRGRCVLLSSRALVVMREHRARMEAEGHAGGVRCFATPREDGCAKGTSYAAPTGRPSTALACRASAFTPCGTPARRCCWRPASTRK